MADTQRYKMGGRQVGGRTYPADTVMKLTRDQAAAMGLTEKDVWKGSTTADSAEHADSYEQAMTSQQEMRDGELARIEAGTAEPVGPAAPRSTTRRGAGS